MGISKRHHYIPQFLIKRFADSDGMLYLYDKEKKGFARERRSAKSVFFEMNRNTLNIDGIANDNLEQLYAALDTTFAMDLKDLLDNGNISVENVASMLLLASSLKWRLPVNDEEFESEDKRLPYDALPIEIRIKNDDGSDNREAMDHILGSQTFRQSKRIILPFLPFYQDKAISEEKVLRAFSDSYINSNDNVKSILGDAPLIEDELASTDNFGNFILPLGNRQTFICTDSPRKKIESMAFYLNKDLLVFHQSKKYVVCADKEYLQGVIQAYETIQDAGATDDIARHIFKFT